MPLRDHFRPPLADFASWEELHGAWPGTIAFGLNTILPREYRSGVRVHVGPAIEIGVAAFENDKSAATGYRLAVADAAVVVDRSAPRAAAVGGKLQGHLPRAPDCLSTVCHGLILVQGPDQRNQIGHFCGDIRRSAGTIARQTQRLRSISHPPPTLPGRSGVVLSSRRTS